MDMSDRYRLRDDNSPDMEKGMHWSIYHIFQHLINKKKINFPHRIDSGAKVMSWGSREALPQYLPIGWYHCGTSDVYVWAKLTLLLINMW